MNAICLLCHSHKVLKHEVTAKPQAIYWHCQDCDYIFMEPAQRLKPQLERERYEQHQNGPTDGYRQFLTPVIDFVVSINNNISNVTLCTIHEVVTNGDVSIVSNSADKSSMCAFNVAPNPVSNTSPSATENNTSLTKSAGSPLTELRCLDYGCGPTAQLQNYLQEKGIAIQSYDPFFKPDRTLLTKQYELITCTEVFEHFYDPHFEIEQLTQMLMPGGHLIVLTSPPPTVSPPTTDSAISNWFAHEFAQWSYRRDATHVGFFSRKCMQHIADKWGLQLIQAQGYFWVLQKLSKADKNS